MMYAYSHAVRLLGDFSGSGWDKGAAIRNDEAACGGLQIKFGPFCQRNKYLRTNEQNIEELRVEGRDMTIDGRADVRWIHWETKECRITK